MRHHARSLLLVVVFGAAAMAASGADDTMPPMPDFQMDFPPLPSPADIPEPPECLKGIQSVCGVMNADNSTMALCCTAVKKLYKSDPKCICDAVSEAQKVVKQYGLDGLEMFRQCDMPTTSCDPGTPGEMLSLLVIQKCIYGFSHLGYLHVAWILSYTAAYITSENYEA